MSETLFERRSAAEEHYRRGLELKRKGYLLEAELEFKQSLETDPAYFDPLLELLVEQEQTGFAEDIRSDQLLRRADQKYKLGVALLEHNRPEKAIRHLEAACELETDNAKYLCALAEALTANKRKSDAREKLRIAANAMGGSEPDKYRARAHYLLGKMHLKDGHLGRARRRLVMAYSMDPKNENISRLLRKAKVGKLRQMLMKSKLKKNEQLEK
jgi:tetratricopeptide (TPR) repeat protein